MSGAARRVVHGRSQNRRRMTAIRKSSGGTGSVVSTIAFLLTSGGMQGALAETISDALIKLYNNNPDISEQRANVRVRDEDVPKAATGMRPKASIAVNGGPQRTYIKAPAGIDQFSSRRYQEDEYSGNPRSGTFNLQQPIFDGGKTRNAISQAESGVMAARATLRQAEQVALQKGATAFVDVLRDAAVLRLKKNNIAVLREQLRVTRDRQEFGEVTRTDVAQADAALAQAESEFTAAEGALQNSMAVYEQVIGEAPVRLEPPPPLEGLIPISRDDAIEEGLKEHPSVVQALHEIDAAESAVKVAEAQLMPTASVGAQIIQQYDSYFGYPGTRQFGAQALAQLNVPLYQGGGEYSGIRQAKEQLGQARIHLNTVRNAVRAAVVQGYAQFVTARSELAFNMKAVKAAETALRGIRDEAAFGQRTTFDVLNAQQKLVEARVNVVTAQRNIIVGSYATLAAMGRLSVAMLRLEVAPYDPAAHLEEVKGKWFGVSTPAQP